MARAIHGSGLVGRKGSRAEAQGTVLSVIGGREEAFAERYGHGHWSYLKAILGEYVQSRQVGDRCVVKAYPFHWLDEVNAKCSAVVLRKDYRRGEHYVEPELYLEVGMMRDASGKVRPGVAYGLHLLDGKDGDDSRFIAGVHNEPRLAGMVRTIAGSGALGLCHATPLGLPVCSPGNGGNGLRWDVHTSLSTTLFEEDMLPGLKDRVFEAFDTVLPFYLEVISL